MNNQKYPRVHFADTHAKKAHKSEWGEHKDYKLFRKFAA